jgi:hypothetical protein
MKIPSYLLLLPALIIFGAACQDRPEPVVSGPVFGAPEVEARLSRLPLAREQPFPFEAQGRLDVRWHGTFVDPVSGAEGVLDVETNFFEPRGETVHLVQTWRLSLPELFQEWTRDDPVRLALTGILNLRNGRLVLNGIVDDGEISQAHVQGQAVVGEDGTFSLGGELMFNPQPEPPE